MKTIPSLAALLFVAAQAMQPYAYAEPKPNPVVRMSTTLGDIEIELYPDKAPLTVRNFLKYVNSNFYNGTVFHRVIPGFMIQGGGFQTGLRQKTARAPIKNEAGNGLKNLAGTVAMARTPDPHSAAAQFFINAVDNGFLDHTAKTPTGWGYCVFGKVISGMDVVQKIEAVPTATVGPFENVPEQDVLIKKMEVVQKPAAG